MTSLSGIRFGYQGHPATLPVSLANLPPVHVDPARAAEDYSRWVTRNSPAYQMEQRGMPPSAIVRYNPFYGNPLAYFQDRQTGNVPPLVNPRLLDWNTYRQYYGF